MSLVPGRRRLHYLSDNPRFIERVLSRIEGYAPAGSASTLRIKTHLPAAYFRTQTTVVATTAHRRHLEGLVVRSEYADDPGFINLTVARMSPRQWSEELLPMSAIGLHLVFHKVSVRLTPSSERQLESQHATLSA
ncbi:hypothetical protein HOI18_01425 [Candidatus Uhrbacteria bacterium]|nr:hypothetical protein [Candidatus Uhrbacteria bacterium]